MAFPGNERVEYEAEVLYPLAGLDPTTARDYDRVQQLAGQLSYAGNEAARRYLDGEIDGAAAAQWLQQYAMFAPDRLSSASGLSTNIGAMSLTTTSAKTWYVGLWTVTVET